MTSVYQTCPEFRTPRFRLRLVREEDAPGLLPVYSDPQAQACFNADNCTSDFRYATLAEMQRCVHMWCQSYTRGDFVRWVILSHEKPVGTVEMFRRDGGADGKGEGVLRIDIHHRYEYADVFDELLRAILPAMHRCFGCERILTKSLPVMMQRRLALVLHGFVPCQQPIIGHGGVAYNGYWAHRHKLA